eukprot:TRINITY_DN835_c0_g1_i3.p1 TRINITY_DN835_c0_g1~~TRINITY_DN835_c0_g1_i3.p1  ORF type:complete len:121 (-),score=30.25 TRINITY_DN835_c0_g1_i3:131-493(-)
MRDMYIKSGEGFLFVFSIIDTCTFDDTIDIIDNVQRIREDMRRTGMVIVANKCDLTDEREVSVQASHDLSLRYNIPLYEVSAKTGQNINMAFVDVVKQVLGVSEKKKKKNAGKKRLCQIL